MQFCLFILLQLLFAGCVNVRKETVVNQEETALVAEKKADGFQNLLESVVRIDVSEANFDSGAMRIERGVGSGVIMSREGHVLTNAHVVSPKADNISVTLASLERIDAKLIGWDHWTDLALLQLNLKELKERGLTFSVAGFGDSERLQPGDTVLAVGTPHGLSRTVTKGIISNPRRYFSGSDSIAGYETGYFNTWLQTDAAINPGNSGGPLVNEDGQVVGINTRGYLGSNSLGFAVPSSIAKDVMHELRLHGEVRRSYVGIKPGPMQDLETFFDLKANTGMLVDSVDPGSPAAMAGLRPGDIVMTIDGESTDGRFPEQLPPILNSIARKPLNQEIVLKVKGAREEKVVTLVTEKLESRMGEQAALEGWGITVQKVSRAIARERKLENNDGVIVIGVQAAFPGGNAGLLAGDIITRINRKSIQEMEMLKEADKHFQETPVDVLLQINRSHRVMYVVLKP